MERDLEMSALATPPPSAKVTVNGGVTRIRIRTPVAPWLRTATWIWILALPFNFVFLSAWNARLHTFDWMSPIVTAIETLYVVIAFGIFFLRVACALAIEIRFDGRNLFIREGDKRDTSATRAELIRWVDVAIRQKRGLHIHPDRPLGQLFGYGPSAALEIHLDEGRVRLFAIREKEELDWICAALRELLELPAEAPTDIPEVVAHVSGIYGLPRTALLIAGFMFSALFLTLAARDVIPGLMSLRWSRVQGVVTRAVYQERISKTRDLAEIAYTYDVLGQTYSGNRVGFGRDEEQKTLRDLVESHPKGSPVAVYYDPDDPKQAVLITGFGVIGWLMLIPGLMALLVCVPFALRGSTARQAKLVKKFRNSAVQD